MKVGWLVGVVMAFVILTIFGIICDQAWFDGKTFETLDALMKPNFGTTNIPLIGLVVDAITTIWDWIQALLIVIFLKFNFFSGNYLILWYIFCLPVGIGLIVSIVITVMRGASSS